MFVLLRIEDDTEAERLVQDMFDYPDSPLLTPTLENTVYATVVYGRTIPGGAS